MADKDDKTNEEKNKEAPKEQQDQSADELDQFTVMQDTPSEDLSADEQEAKESTPSTENAFSTGSVAEGGFEPKPDEAIENKGITHQDLEDAEAAGDEGQKTSDESSDVIASQGGRNAQNSQGAGATASDQTTPEATDVTLSGSGRSGVAIGINAGTGAGAAAAAGGEAQEQVVGTQGESEEGEAVREAAAEETVVVASAENLGLGAAVIDDTGEDVGTGGGDNTDDDATGGGDDSGGGDSDDDSGDDDGGSDGDDDTGGDGDPPVIDPLLPNISVRVSNATDNQTTINSTDGFDLVPEVYGESQTVFGQDMDIAGVSNGANVSFVFHDENTVEVTLNSAWNSVKNVEVSSDSPANITLNNFVHTDVTLGGEDGGDASIVINGAKRGNIETAGGNDTVDINSYTNNSGWSNKFNVSTGAGDDVIELTGDKGHTGFNVNAGSDNDTITIDGNYVGSQTQLGSGDDVFTGGSGQDIISGGEGQDTIESGSGDDVITGGKGKDTFVIKSTDRNLTIKDFGGVGGGGSGEANLLPEHDMIKFAGEGLTAENMLVEYDGTNTLITFEGVEGFSVTLENFDFTDLDNLPAVSAFNILFDGQTTGNDAYDIFNDHSSNQGTIWNRDSVTHLNEADNTVTGKTGSDDVINAMEGDDTISGLSGDDTLRGQAGDDTLIGGQGTDTLVGGTGDDVAVFTGNRSDYTVTQNEDGSYLVVDQTAGRDGSDTVREVETFRFADGDYAEGEEVLTPPVDIEPQPFILGGKDIASDDYDVDMLWQKELAGHQVTVTPYKNLSEDIEGEFGFEHQSGTTRGIGVKGGGDAELQKGEGIVIDFDDMIVNDLTVSVRALFQEGQPSDGVETGEWTAFLDGTEVGSGSFDAVSGAADGRAEFLVSAEGGFDELIFGSSESGSDYHLECIEGLIPAEYLDDSEIVSPVLMDSGNYDLTGVSGFRIEADSIASKAGYNNSFGHFFADAQGNPISGVIDFANVKPTLGEGDPSVFEYSMSDLPEGAAQLGFFIVPDGARKNANLEDGTEVTFEQQDGVWVPTVDGEALDGRNASAYFSDTSLNPDGEPHMTVGEEGSVHWEDLFGGGDEDFNDATLNVTVEGTIPDQLEAEDGAPALLADDNDEVGAMIGDNEGNGWSDIVDNDQEDDGGESSGGEGDNGWVEVVEQGEGSGGHGDGHDPDNPLDDDGEDIADPDDNHNNGNNNIPEGGL